MKSDHVIYYGNVYSHHVAFAIIYFKQHDLLIKN